MDEVLDFYHAGENFNYDDIRKSMTRYHRQARFVLFPLIFRGQKWTIWDALMVTSSTTTGELSKLTGIPSKNLSSQLASMAKTGLVKFTREGKLKSWTKID